MWGVKKARKTPESALSTTPTALVRLRRATPANNAIAANTTAKIAHQGTLHTSKKTAAFTVLNAEELSSQMLAPSGAYVKEVLRVQKDASAQKPIKSMQQRLSLRGVGAHNFDRISHNSTDEVLPKNFDWREALAGMVPPGEDPLAEQIDQGPCGSCYAFAGTMVLQMRFRVKLFQEHGILYPLELSYKSVAQCSPYTEGCNGGFSYFTSRLSSEVGVPLAECDKDVSAGSLNSVCDWRCYKNNTNLFYAKDYWHVGGFSQGSDEASIMREIYINGPVELGFSTTAVPEFVALSGRSVADSTEVMTVIRNDKTPTEKYSSNPKVRHWIYSTHAILAVGWGEDVVAWGMVKYWTVRNSWGRDWGTGGYAKMRRGNNDGGVETDASMALPDMQRLPAGFLETAKKWHDSQAANRKAWAKEQGKKGKKKPTGPGGIPEYCKQRPNSVDCK